MHWDGNDAVRERQMTLRSFRVQNQKALRFAECEQVPSVMIIAGPNGVGKSTLLYALHRKKGATYDDGTQVIYQPPHRAVRRQQVRRRFLGGAIRGFSEILAGTDVSGFEGLSIPFPARAPDNVDEAGSTIKYTLGKIENRRQNALARMVDDHRASARPLDAAGLPNIYAPLERLTSRLLPHLAFRHVDFSDEENVRCVFERTDVVGVDPLDLDDLSSGEKSIILLFLPLIENEINRLFALLGSGEGTLTASESMRDRVFLIDEPEQHLHPDLQARIIGYLRDEVTRQGIQFVMATHSPTFVDQAFDDELYILNFPRAARGNQLRRVAATSDRLEAIKALTGTTYVVTTGRSIVCVEGEKDGGSGGPTDLGLLQILHPQATRFTFVPVGGKGNVISIVRQLRDNLPEEHFGIKVFGIVDRDRSTAHVDGVVTWPVCSIENLLIDAQAITECVASLAPERSIVPEEVEAVIARCAREQRDDEIRIRVMLKIKPRTVRIGGASVQQVREAYEAELAALQLSEARISDVVADATSEVDRALNDGSYKAVFRGKTLLKSIYRQLELHELQLSYEKFTYKLAQVSASKGSVSEVLDEVFRNLQTA